MKSSSRRYSLLRAAAVLLLAGAAGCGVKGPPRPPALPAPEAPAKFQVRVRGGCVEMRWAAPEVSAEQPAAVAYEVLEAEVLEGQTPVYQVANRTRFTQYKTCKMGPGARELFKVRGISGDGRPGDETEAVAVTNAFPPPPPSNLQAAGGDGFVELTWDPPPLPAGAGFNVYRSQAATRFPWHPVNIEPVTGGGFVDGPLENGTRYYYQVRAVLPVPGSRPVEGPAAPLATAVPADLTPPARPEGLTGLWTGHVVELHWLSNQDPDLKGYIVARSPKGREEWRELFPDPISQTTYLDHTAQKGVEYDYAVYAVDQATPPNRSAASQPLAVYAGP
jgi:hypothetical protein